MQTNTLQISVIFDNVCGNQQLASLWGFSCVIQTPKHTILFDTGSNGRLLLQNLAKKNLELSNLNNIFISHAHWDHIGGIDSVLEVNPNVDIFVTSHLSKNLIRDLGTLSNSVTVIDNSLTEILPNIYSTGGMGDESEQSLIIDTDEGLLIIAGCAHSGIELIAKRAKEKLNKRILLLLGGFHLHNKEDNEVLKIINTIKQLDTKYVCPSHCTGERATKLFKEAFKQHHIDGGVGVEIGFDGEELIVK